MDSLFFVVSVLLKLLLRQLDQGCLSPLSHLRAESQGNSKGSDSLGSDPSRVSISPSTGALCGTDTPTAAQAHDSVFNRTACVFNSEAAGWVDLTHCSPCTFPFHSFSPFGAGGKEWFWSQRSCRWVPGRCPGHVHTEGACPHPSLHPWAMLEVPGALPGPHLHHGINVHGVLGGASIGRVLQRQRACLG